VYPNPVSGDFFFVETTQENSLIQLFNINGQKVYSTYSTGRVTEINISNFKSGLYFVKTNSGAEKLIIK